MFRPSTTLASWGRVLRAPHDVASPRFRDELADAVRDIGVSGRKGLAVGLCRSYGDSCLNPGGAVVAMRGLDRIHAFDRASGVVRADAGLSIGDLIAVALPCGYVPPVVPGTQFVTLGGAVANDVHGKNHHDAGTFGCHVRALSLRRSDGTTIELRADEPDPLFAATIGGLGLTGIIEWVEIDMLRVGGNAVNVDSIPFESLSAFYELTDRSVATHPYTVAWIDCTRMGSSLGRGIYARASHAATTIPSTKRKLKVPFELPAATLNAFTLKAFNTAYYALKKARAGNATVHCNSFFFPLDAIAGWNKLYGAAGMYQYQCVIPPAVAQAAVTELLQQIAKSGDGSFLAVLKTFGPKSSPGLLSFPREGTTLALDFRNRGDRTLKLFEKLDHVVREANGRLYAAKDGRIPAAMFAAGYPELATFARHVDPFLSSAFWERVRP